MVPLSALLIPIVVSAVIVFVASSLIHMVTPWHKGDFAKVPNEDQTMDALRPLKLPPGDYMMPRPASMEDMKTEAYKAKLAKGPRAIMTVLPPFTGMGRELGLWFVFVLAVSIYSAYLTGAALPAATPYLKVFQVAGATAFAAYAFAIWPLAIWYRRSMRMTITATVDALLFALLTAGTFGWRWPK